MDNGKEQLSTTANYHNIENMITKEYVTFFRELEENNHKEWFHANKKRYEQFVKAPFHELVTNLIASLREIDPEIPEDPKAIIMRINKDIRFSKDKRPYNLMMKANFTPGGRKSPNPGFYLGIGADNVHIGGGLYHPTPQDLKRIRSFIVGHQDKFMEILRNPSFQEQFESIKGDQAKRLDKELTAAAEELPILYNKQFFYMKQLPISQYLDRDIASALSPTLQSCAPIHSFLKDAVDGSES